MVLFLKIEVCVLIPFIYIYQVLKKFYYCSSCRISTQQMTCAIPLYLSLCIRKRVQNLLHIVFTLYEKVLLQKVNVGNWTSARQIHQGNVSLTLKFMWLFHWWKGELLESFWNTAECPHPQDNSWRMWVKEDGAKFRSCGGLRRKWLAKKAA